MAGTSADRDRHTAITADVPNQNLMPYCRYRFSLQMATTVAEQQPGALRRKPTPAALLACVVCCAVSRKVQHCLEAVLRMLLLAAE
jgi:hypothetical protein